MEREIVKVVFTFKGGGNKTLEDGELINWKTICYLTSDYLLPGDVDHVLAKGFSGIVCGFVPSGAIGRGGWESFGAVPGVTPKFAYDHESFGKGEW